MVHAGWGEGRHDVIEKIRAGHRGRNLVGCRLVSIWFELEGSGRGERDLFWRQGKLNAASKSLKSSTADHCPLTPKTRGMLPCSVAR